MIAKQQVLKHMYDLINTIFFHTQHPAKSFPSFFLYLIQMTTLSKIILIFCFTSTILSYFYVFFYSYILDSYIPKSAEYVATQPLGLQDTLQYY
jgi:hypothetical protein